MLANPNFTGGFQFRAATTLVESEMEDHELLHEFARNQSEAAFAELVSRHINLVYSAALRLAGEPEFAKDVAQTVFIGLARNPNAVRNPRALAAWLYGATRFAAATALRSERRRRQRESDSMQLELDHSEPQADWQSLAPHVEEAMSSLDDTEQSVVVMRFFQDRSLREVGGALGLSENAAQKRVTRALEKLRLYLRRRGIATSSALLGTMLTAHAVQAAPTGLASSVATISLSAASTTTGAAIALTKTIIMTTKAKILLGVGTIIVLATVPTSLFLTQRMAASIPTNGVISVIGVVRDTRGNPIEGAVVGIPPGTRDGVKTDTQGKFSFNLKTKHALGVEADPQRVISRREFTQPYIFVRDSENHRAGIIPLGNPTKEKAITLTRSLTFTGRVVNEERIGMGGVDVIFSLSPTGTVWDAYFADSTVTTDDQGRYQIHGLPILPRGYYGIHVRWAPGRNGSDWVGQVRINNDEGTFAEAEDRHSSTRWPTKKDENWRVPVQDIVVAQQRAQFR